MSERSENPPVRAVRWAGDVAVVEVSGEIDLNSSPELQQVLLELFDRRPSGVVVNLKDVPYMDSSGVASLVKALARARRNNISLRLTGMTDRVRSVFEITRLDSVFDIYGSEEEALANP